MSEVARGEYKTARELADELREKTQPVQAEEAKPQPAELPVSSAAEREPDKPDLRELRFIDLDQARYFPAWEMKKLLDHYKWLETDRDKWLAGAVAAVCLKPSWADQQKEIKSLESRLTTLTALLGRCGEVLGECRRVGHKYGGLQTQTIDSIDAVLTAIREAKGDEHA